MAKQKPIDQNINQEFKNQVQEKRIQVQEKEFKNQFQKNKNDNQFQRYPLVAVAISTP